MIASVIGQTFLDEYNKTQNSQYTPKAFFAEVFVPLFFDYPRYLMKGGNAPLDNPKIKKGHPPNKEERAERIQKTINLIETNPAGSSAIGYPSVDFEATTSGQVTNMDLNITPEQVYLSWIGGALGIGVNGGLCIFFNHPQILMDTFKGWKIYRQLLKDTPGMKGNQIETWNGQWVADFYGVDENNGESFTNFDALDASKDVIQLKTQSWVSLLFEISKQFPNQNLVGYVYSYGQTNTTLGFIPFKMYEIQRPMQLYKKYFGELEFTKDQKKIKDIYGTNYGLRAACANGTVGLKAIQPKALKPFLPNPKGRPKFFKFTGDSDNQIQFQTFITWVSAMINNEKLINMAESVAEILIKFEGGAEKAKTDRANLTKQLLDTTSRKKFINALIPIVEKADVEAAKQMNELVIELDKMPAENFSYFVTLIRFKYAYLKK